MKELKSYRRKQETEIQGAPSVVINNDFCGMKLIFLGKRFKPVEGSHNLFFSACAYPMSRASARNVEINPIPPLPHEREKEPEGGKKNSAKSRLKKCFTFDFQLIAVQQLN